MKLKILIGFLVFLIVVNLATIGSFLYFQWQSPEHPGPPHKRLRLGPQKESRLRDLLRSFHRETREQRHAVRQLEREVFELLQAESPDREAIAGKLRDIETIQFDIRKKMIDKLLETKTFLSPQEQERFYNALLRARPAFDRRGPRFGPGGPRSPFKERQSNP